MTRDDITIVGQKEGDSGHYYFRLNHFRFASSFKIWGMSYVFLLELFFFFAQEGGGVDFKEMVLTLFRRLIFPQ